MTNDDDKKPDETKLHTFDKSLLHAAQTGEGAVPLTPDLLEQIARDLTARRADITARYPKLVAECPYETRLAVAAWVVQHICEHARDGGTFRYLIYERMGFGPDAYMPLMLAGALDISNEFTLPGTPVEPEESR